MLGLIRYEAASPSSGTDRAYERHRFRYPGNKSHQLCLPSQILTDSLEGECRMCADEGTRILAALWTSTHRLTGNEWEWRLDHSVFIQALRGCLTRIYHPSLQSTVNKSGMARRALLTKTNAVIPLLCEASPTTEGYLICAWGLPARKNTQMSTVLLHSVVYGRLHSRLCHNWQLH